MRKRPACSSPLGCHLLMSSALRVAILSLQVLVFSICSGVFFSIINAAPKIQKRTKEKFLWQPLNGYFFSNSSVDQIAVDNFRGLPVCSFASGTLTSLRGTDGASPIDGGEIETSVKRQERRKGNIESGYMSSKRYSASSSSR